MRSPIPTSLFDQFARGWRGYALIALIALASATFGAGRMPVMDVDEARYAQASRQMAETDDYVRIRLQEAERNRKPIGVHWLQAASVQTFSPDRLNAIWAYRLPSALGLVLAALALLWGGGVLVGPRAALLGAGLFAAGMLAGFEAMTAKTDALLVGFTTLAMAALARLRMSAPRPRLTALVFWAALACGVLIKGPVTPLVAALTLIALMTWERRAAWAAPLLWWIGPVLGVLIAAPWFLAIGAATEGRFLADMFGGDIAPKMVSGVDGHFALPGFHLFLLPFLIFPATYALPAAVRLAWDALRAPRAEESYAATRFVIAWVLPTFVFFELMPTKLPHYVLPTYPAIALLCGAGLMAMIGRPWRTASPAGLVLFAVAGLMIVALTALAATFMPGDFATDLRRAVSAALIGVGVVGVSLAALVMLPWPAARAAVLIACALTMSFSLRERLLPEARELHVSTEAVAALTRARLTPRDNRPLWVVGYREASIVFLTRTSIHLADAAEAGARAQAGDAVVVESRALQEFSAQLATRDLAFESAEPPVQGLSLTQGERWSLFIGRVVPLSAEPAGAPPPDP